MKKTTEIKKLVKALERLITWNRLVDKKLFHISEIKEALKDNEGKYCTVKYRIMEGELLTWNIRRVLMENKEIFFNYPNSDYFGLNFENSEVKKIEVN